MSDQLDCKYKVGDRVVISKEFRSSPYGHIVNIEPVTATVTRVSITVTYGPAYSLEVKGNSLPVMFWENDIDCIANMNNGNNN